jgi:hypothetical protein
MHGQIGDLRDGAHNRGDLDFYYRTRAALIEAHGQLGGGAIDCDFYRMRAHRMRGRVRRKFFRSLLPCARPLAAVALLVAAIFMLPRHASDCPSCDAPARPFESMNLNPYSNLYPNNPSE